MKFFCFVSMALLVFVSCAKQGEQGSELHEILSQYLDAQDPVAARTVFEEQFGALGLTELSRLRFHENDTIAIRSSWELLVRKSSAVDEHSEHMTELVQRFVGFVEGRLQFEPPDFFQKIRPVLSGSKNIFFDLPTKSDEFVLDQVSKFRFPSCVQIDSYPEYIEVSIGSKVHVTLDKNCIDFDCVDGKLVGEDYCLLRFFGIRSSRQRLICFCAKSGSKLWEQGIWCGGDKYGYTTGLGAHLSEMIFTENRLFVIGVSNDCIYIEGFNAKTGVPLIRFGSSY